MNGTSSKYGTHTNRSYGFVSRLDAWCVTFVEDQGLINVMSSHGVEKQYMERHGVMYPYWVLSRESFDSVKEMLDLANFHDYNETHKTRQDVPKTSASFQPAKMDDYSSFTLSEPTYSVTELNRRLHDLVEKDFTQEVWIKGEIIKFNEHPNGNVYFMLVDKETADSSQNVVCIKAIIMHWNYKKIQAKVSLNDGIEIRIKGKVSCYERNAEISFFISDIDPKYSEGRYLKIKAEIENKLWELGIHDNNKNLPFPLIPKRLAVFSNDSAEGYRDFYTKLEQSGYSFEITLFEISLQGKQKVENSFKVASDQMKSMGFDNFDLALILRGGGGRPELDSFNSLPVAEFIARCPVKFLIGIGHKRDRSVLDEIAYDALTPTDAGIVVTRLYERQESFIENAVQSIKSISKEYIHEFKRDLELKTRKCADLLQKKKEIESMKLVELKNSIKNTAKNRILTKKQLLFNASQSIRTYSKDIIEQQRCELNNFSASISDSWKTKKYSALLELNSFIRDIKGNCQSTIHSERHHLDISRQSISTNTKSRIESNQSRLEKYTKQISLLNPQDIFRRGFVAIHDQHGKRLTSVQHLKPGQTLQVRLVDGKLNVTIDEIQKTDILIPVSDKDTE